MTARSHADHAHRRDAAAALVWAVVSAGGLLLLLGPVARSEGVHVAPLLTASVVAVAVAQCLLLVLRHRRPVLTLALVSVLQAGLLAVLPADTSLQGAGLLVAAYTAGTLLPGHRLVAAVTASVAVQAVGLAAAAPGPGAALLTAAGAATTTSAAAAVGGWVALRRAHQRSLLAAAAAQVEHQAVLARTAVAEERTRMARELHDVAAHHLSGIVVQAGAAERLVDTDPERAKAALRDLREQGRATLRDMRSIVGILRASADASASGRQDDDGGGAPVPGLAQLPALVESARSAGDRVEARWSGPEVVLPPLADVAVYRTAQEALANARRHAPGARVVLAVTTAVDRVRLEVENEVLQTSPSQPAPSPPGLGLTGMRERADLVRGHLDVGPTGRGTWRVAFEVAVPAVPVAEAHP